MARFFREPDRRQRYLLPVDMMDWLPEGDIVHLIVDAVALMDLSGFEATCKVGKAGQAPFSPRVLLALLIYAYSHGIRSSRAIERLCGRDVGYRFIVGAAVPDHSVIARFRQRHVERMKAVFLAVLELCRAAGLIRLGLVALDGTKVKANAALDANRTASSGRFATPGAGADANVQSATTAVDVPAPPWMTPTLNWSCSSPARMRTQILSIRSALSGSRTPISLFARAHACLTTASALTRSE